MSHTKDIRLKYLAYKRVVLRLTGLSADAYHNLQFDLAKQYLEFMLGDDPLGINYVYSDKQFWNWFLNKWNQSDVKEVVPALYKIDVADRAERYKLMHFNLLIVQEQKPILPQHVLNEMYLKSQGLRSDLVQLKQKEVCK